MTKNVDFAVLLQNEGRLVADTARADARDKGLEAIVAQDPTKPGLVRQAILSHQGYFQHQVPDTGGVNADRYQDTADFMDDSNNAILCQFAAQQRVTCGLARLSEAELIAFVKEVDAQKCREQLSATTEMSFLQKAPNWKANSAGTLDDGKVRYLQLQALQLMVYRKLQTASAKEIADFETNYATNPAGTIAGLLGNKITVASALVIPGIFRTNQVVNPTNINALIVERKKDFAKTAFIEIVDKLTPQQASTAAMFRKLANDTADFKADTTEGLNISNVDDGEIPDLQGKLGLKYIQGDIANITVAADAKALFESVDLKTSLEGRYSGGGDVTFVASSLGQQNSENIIKRAAAVQYIKLDTTLIAADKSGLIPATGITMSLAVFKNELKKIGVKPVDWVTEADMIYMQNQLRREVLKSTLAKESLGGTDAHEKLLEAYAQLSPDQQEKVGADLRTVMNTTNIKVLEYYFGKDSGVDLNAIILQNERMAAFKAIRNPEVAKILANFKPKIDVTKMNVDAINAAFVTGSPPKAINFEPSAGSFHADYADFVNTVEAACGIAVSNRNAFSTAFGLNAARDAYNGQGSESVVKQQKMNEDVLNNLQQTTDYEKGFTTFVASIPKTDKIQPKMPESLDDFNSIDKFVGAMAPPTGYAKTQAHTDRFKKQLTPEMLTNFRKQNIAALFQAAKNKPDTVVTQIENNVGQLNKDRRALMTDKKQKVLALKGFTEDHARSPAFVNEVHKNPIDMRSKYTELNQECTRVIHRLSRDKSILESNLESIQDNALKPVTPKNRSLQMKLQLEIDQINKDLTDYKDAQTGINNALVVVNEGMKTKEMVVVGSEWSVEDPIATIQKGVRKSGVSIPLLKGTTILETQLAQPLTAGNSRSYTLSAPVPVGGTADPKLEGKFTQTALKNGAQRFDINNFPTGSDNEQQKAAFAMGLARQLLAAHGGVPKKKEPIVINSDGIEDDNTKEALRYLWTALVVLGENSKDNKFSANAIEVNSNVFDPADEAMIMGRGWDANSLYKTVFTNTGPNSAKREVQTHLTQANKLESVSREAGAQHKSASEFKGNLDKLRAGTKTLGITHGVDDKHNEQVDEADKDIKSAGLGGHG